MKICKECIKKHKAELEKKDKIIDLMADKMSDLCTGIKIIREQFEKEYCEFVNNDDDCCYKTDKKCADCIIEYFTNKVEEGR